MQGPLPLGPKSVGLPWVRTHSNPTSGWLPKTCSAVLLAKTFTGHGRGKQQEASPRGKARGGWGHRGSQGVNLLPTSDTTGEPSGGALGPWCVGVSILPHPSQPDSGRRPHNLSLSFPICYLRKQKAPAWQKIVKD